MRHRVAVIGTSETTRSVALLLVARDDSQVLLTGEDGGALQAAAAALGVEPRVDGPVDVTELTGTQVVVVCEPDGVPVQELRTRAPHALLIVATADPEADARALQDHLRWPRQRVIGIDACAAAGAAPQRAAAAVRLVDFVLADRGRTVEATVQRTAEGGAGSWGSVPVTLGAVGVQSIDG
jgi:malate/lactate dehydrogenase